MKTDTDTRSAHDDPQQQRTHGKSAAAVEFHPIANLFPLMEGEEFTALVEDIRKHRLQYGIVIYQGKILDGRNRYRACREIGIEPASTEFEGTEAEARDYVISANI